ncbi:hypothetical protein ACS0TY_005062 [Phlomoides rotata]
MNKCCAFSGIYSPKSAIASEMLCRVSLLSPKTSLLFSHFCKSSNTILFRSKCINYYRHSHSSMTKNQLKSPISMAREAAHFSTASAEAVLQNSTDLGSRASRKKARMETPEAILRWKLDCCSKNGDWVEALRLYNEARANNIQLNEYHYNILLYLCSSKSDDSKEDGEDPVRLDKGFEIFKQMGIDNVAPNEATYTNVSRLAAAKKDPELAFSLIRQMKDHGIIPKLRSYGPALQGFVEKGMADEAYEVDSHMADNGVPPEETELSALLKVSSEVKREEKVYELMHRLRTSVRQVSEETAAVMEGWFSSSRAAEVGVEKWNVVKVKIGVLEGGGGWHGQGWLGKGNWRVERTRINETGICQSCGEKLVCIDIDPKETENFAESVAKLAGKREIKANFIRFQEWLQRNGPFDVVLDGANLGLANQKYNFSFAQIKRVVNQLREISPSKKLLIVLHRSRVTGGPAQHPNNKRLIESWQRAGALYSTPQGSDDDCIFMLLRDVKYAIFVRGYARLALQVDLVNRMFPSLQMK